VTPVVAIDGVALSDGKPGPVTRRVQKLYYTAIGADVAKAAPWLSE
jgi:D-alanine transaminase